MSERSRAEQSPVDRPVLAMLGRVGSSLTAVVGLTTAVLSAATIYLVLSRPLEVADALVEPRTTQVVQALAGLVFAALRDLLSYL